MAHTRKDTLTVPREWAKHLRKFEKRKHAKAERRASKREMVAADGFPAYDPWASY